ncbi:MAG TPA: hypothetical protein VMT50_08435, partial [Steroidobacteraceae bacterium]|nr:hypothetical protein [Steroidobacteraceae bacterium]
MTSRTRTILWSSVLLSIALVLPATAARAADIDCTSKCHQDVHFKSAAHPDTKCAECHTNITAVPHDKLPDDQKLTSQQICAGCHGMAAKQVAKSVHEKKGCKGCHGTGHKVDVAANAGSRLSPTGQVDTCGNCHEEMVKGFANSVHGRGLLQSGLVKSAPSCSSCHGTHSIQKHADDKAKTGHLHSPETCGACHETILNVWQDLSAHGQAWKNGNNKGPVCVDCHMKEHGVQAPTSPGARKAMPDKCGNCHKDLIESYRDSFHGKATALGWSEVATCADCHTPHQNLPAKDPNSTVNPANLATTCGKCHEQEVKNAGFLTFDPHVRPTAPGARPVIKWIFYFMTALLLGVFAFFFAHDFL